MLQFQNTIAKYVSPTDVQLQLLSNSNFLYANNIIYIQALSNYCKIFLTNGKQIVIAKTLKKVEDILDSYTFLRIHNSIIININFIDKYKIIDYQKVYLQNGTCFTISRRKKIAFKKYLDNNLLIAS